jgi:hypothetical protein
MKVYTDISQSKKLAEILPLESADMYYDIDSYGIQTTPEVLITSVVRKKDIPCWSLAALYSILPTFTLDSSDDKYFRIHCCNKFSEWYNNPIDACVEMIIKLKDLNLL